MTADLIDTHLDTILTFSKELQDLLTKVGEQLEESHEETLLKDVQEAFKSNISNSVKADTFRQAYLCIIREINENSSVLVRRVLV
jgi:phage-related minor tail protein